MISFANELLLLLFRLLPLRSLIVARGVDRRWRQLVSAADLHPHRRRLLDLYLTLINSPSFAQTRPWVLANLQPFDRDAYLAALLAKYPRLPDTFVLWLLEWPARAVIGGIWPGLPLEHKEDSDEMQVFQGRNLLAPGTVQVAAITYSIPDRKDQYDFLPAILIRTRAANTWLVLDDAARTRGTLALRDKVFTLFGRARHLNSEEGDSGPGWDVVDADWIAFQRRTWEDVEKRVVTGEGIPYLPARHWSERKSYVGAPPWAIRRVAQQPRCTSLSSCHFLEAHRNATPVVFGRYCESVESFRGQQGVQIARPDPPRYRH